MPLANSLRHPFLAILEPVASLLERLYRVLPQADLRKSSGHAGERAAYFFLRRQGYLVVARQWRAPNIDGEIDLIAWQGDTLCFVEVKTRRDLDAFSAAYTIHPAKLKDLRRMAHAYIQGLPWQGDSIPNPPIRFDSISVDLLSKPTHITQQINIL